MDILLMGDSKAGRSSIAKVIFQKMVSKSTKLLGETSKMESYDFKIQKIEFKLYDFPARYDITEPPPNEQMIFKNASALIYVLSPQSDISKSMDTSRHLQLPQEEEHQQLRHLYFHQQGRPLTQPGLGPLRAPQQAQEAPH